MAWLAGILVNNAGTSAKGEFQAVTDEAWQADFDLKLFSAIRLARLAIPHMKQHGWGRIVNVTTIGAKQPHARSMPTTVIRQRSSAHDRIHCREMKLHVASSSCAHSRMLFSILCRGPAMATASVSEFTDRKADTAHTSGTFSPRVTK